MACTITIKPPVTGTGIPPTSITTTGTATDCKQVTVSLRCSNGPVLTLTVPVDVTGNWTALFANLGHAGCNCDGLVSVRAVCEGNPDCEASFEGILQCAQEECPEVNVWATPESICDGFGNRPVQFHAFNNGPGTPQAYWTADDGYVGVDFVLVLGPNDEPTHPMAQGPHTATLHVQGCDPQQTSVFGVEACLPTGPCPSINIAEERSNCRENGTQPITIVVTITGTPGVNIEAELREGGALRAGGSSAVGVLTLLDTRDYPAGSHTLTVVIVEPAECPTFSTTIEVECVTKGACCLPDGSCVELTEAECRARQGNYQGDSMSCADTECNGGNGKGGGLGCLCLILLAFALAAILAAGGLLIGGFCSGNLAMKIAGFTSAGLGILLLLLWWWLCASESECETINTLIRVVVYHELTIMPLAVLLSFLLGGLLCGLGAVLTWGYYGVILAILYLIAKDIGCIVEKKKMKSPIMP